MRTMRKLLLIPLALLLLLSACGSESGDRLATPFEQIVDSLRTGDVRTYESAFPPDFCSTYRSEFPNLSETVALLLSATAEYDVNAYGEDSSVAYEIESTERSDPSLYEGAFEFANLDSFSTTLPRADDALRVTVTVTRSGSFDEKTTELTYILLQYGGTWYLHPKHFGTVLND